MDNNLKGKIALVTGSGKKTGIGYAIAKKFASEGCDIIIADYGTEKGLNADVKTGSMNEMMVIGQELSHTYDVETLVVNVDVTLTDTITFDVNLHGVFRMSKAIVPMMQEKGGNIINIASRAGKVPALFNGAYSVSKAGVIMLTKVMAKELAGLNIRINAICPGQIMTDLKKWGFEQEAAFFNTTVEEQEQKMCDTIPAGRIGLPQEVADMALFLASDASSYVTGQALNVCGGQLMEL